MRAVVIHSPRDLRVEAIAASNPPDRREVEVSVKTGGICGSDLHYYLHGGFGAVRIREPMVLGHEIAGIVTAVGPDVSDVGIGTRVAVNPSRPCGTCRYCSSGVRQQCIDMRFLGSAMRFPHVQGGFCQSIVVDASQVVPIPNSMSFGEAAMAEPLAVCLHAAAQAGALLGKRVLVTGCGPIGALCVSVCRLAGAAEIVVTDITDQTLEVARSIGASRIVNVARDGAQLDAYRSGKGCFDVLFEASGTQAALVSGLDLVRPAGLVVQLGLGGDMTLPINTIVAKELQVRGTFPFDTEFDLAVRLMGEGLIDVKPLITATLPFDAALEAFELAKDRSRAMKVHLKFC